MPGRSLTVILILITIAIFWRLWQPYLHVATDFSYAYPSSFELRSLSPPQAWRAVGSDGLGFFSADTQWSWIVDLFVFALGKSGLPFWAITYLVFLLPAITFSILGSHKLLGSLNIGPSGKFVGGLFHLTNTYFLLLLDGGQLSLALSYSLLPLAFYSFRRAFEDPRFFVLLKFSLSILLISVLDLRFVYLFLVLASLNVVYHLPQIGQSFPRYLKICLFTGILLTSFHFYWILPTLASQASSLPSSYSQSSQLSFLNFTTLGHSLIFLQPHWFKNIFGQITPLRPEFVGLPILAFLAPLLIKSRKETGFWLFSALVLIFLTKGSSPPFPGLYNWLFSHLPGFFLFRDSTKFFSLLALPYMVLISLATHKLSKVFPLVIWIIAAYLIALASPVFLGKMTGMFSRPPLIQQYFDLAGFFDSDHQFGRIAWVPSKPPLGFYNNLHPTLEASTLVQKRPFALGVVGRYEAYNFLRQAPYMPELFDVAAIKYLVNPPPDARRDPSKPDNLEYYATFLSQLSLLSWLDLETSPAPIPVFKVAAHQDRLFLTPNTWFVSGSDEDTYLSGLKLSQNALIFIDQHLGLLADFWRFPQAAILLTGTSSIDLAANLLPPFALLSPSSRLSPTPSPVSPWWKVDGTNLIWWRDFLQQKYGIDNTDLDLGQNWAVAEGETTFSLNLPACQSPCVLLGRVMKSSQGGDIVFLQNNKRIGEIRTFSSTLPKKTLKITGSKTVPSQTFTYDKAVFNWHEVGSVEPPTPLTLRTSGRINVVNALATIPLSTWLEIRRQAIQMLDRSQPTATPSAQLSYRRLSPTRYQVQISNLSQPATLVFSENFNFLWRLNGQSSTPIYGFLNGFLVSQNGQYELVFSPQHYLDMGFVASSLLVLVLFLISLRICVRK